MSLSRREQRLLDRASTALRRTDPALAAKFAVFGQAADGEPVPGHEQLPSRPDWPGRAVLTWLARLAALAHPASGRRRRDQVWPDTQPLAGSPGIAQEDTMSAFSRNSPLPPDPIRHGPSPLPPDPAPSRSASPLPPDPGLPVVPRPRLAADDMDRPGGSDRTGQSGRGPAETR